MSKYNFARIIFIGLLLCSWYTQSSVLAIAATIIFLTLLSIGTFFIRWNFYHKSVHHIANSSAVFLTFDDGPHPEFTPKILSILRQHGCKAIFFIIGKNIKGNEHLLQRMVTDGHTIGIHTWSHSYWFDLFTTAKMKQEIVATQLEINRVTGLLPLLFRPPYGVTNPMLARAMKQTKVISMGWSIRSLDTVIHSPEKIIARISKKLRPQRIVLLHDTQPHTVEVLNDLLKLCAAKKLPIGDVQKYLGCYGSAAV